MATTSPLPDKDQCAICKTQQGITTCKSCQTLFYCGTAHQKADWPNHKKVCKATKMGRERVWDAMEHIKHCLEEAGGDYKAYFRSSPPEVEAYLHYRYIYARALIKPATRSGVVKGLESCLEVARLDTRNIQNGQTAREFVPGLLLRLGRDQECYDFVKEKCNGDLEEIYRCDANTNKPRRPAKAEDFSLSHAAMLCLLKLRILRDLRSLEQADSALGNRLPAELFAECRSHLVGPATKMDAARMKAIEKRTDLTPYAQAVETDVKHLRGYINALNKDYFKAIADPETYKQMQPMYQPELPIVEALAQTYEAWAETEGAFGLWRELCVSWDNESR